MLTQKLYSTVQHNTIHCNNKMVLSLHYSRFCSRSWFGVFTGVLFLCTTSTTIVVQAQDEDVLMPRCGDCFCVPEGGVEVGSCPTDTTGIVDSLDPTEYCYLDTFVLTNPESDFLKLQTADGDEDCYPFTNSMGVLNRAPQTQLPPCAVPTTPTTTTDTQVCAYKFDTTTTQDEDTTCVGRDYQVVTYDTPQEAVADGAVVTHTGGCGVCSSAHDFYVRIAIYETLETDSLICATSYSLSQDTENRFGRLVQCFEDMGFGKDCATLWAHSAAVNAIGCINECFPDATGTTLLNEAAPFCELAPCLTCSIALQAEFDVLAGRTLQNSGITEDIVRPCDAFSRIEHNQYCTGTTQVGSCTAEPPAGPTPAPQAQENDGTFSLTTHRTVLMMIGGSLLAILVGM